MRWDRRSSVGAGIVETGKHSIEVEAVVVEERIGWTSDAEVAASYPC